MARGPRQSALELIRPDDHGKVQTVQDGARDGGDRHGIVTAHGLLIYCSSSLCGSASANMRPD